MAPLSRSRGSGQGPKATPDDAACLLVEALVEWCTSESLDASRRDFSIPECAEPFGCEMFYLYVFLLSVSIEMSYASRVEFGVSVARGLMDKVRTAMEGGRFGGLGLSFEQLEERYRQYLDLRLRGVRYLTENLPYTFLVTNGVCPSEKWEDMTLVGRPLLTMQLWVGEMLNRLCEANRKWQDKFLD